MMEGIHSMFDNCIVIILSFILADWLFNNINYASKQNSLVYSLWKSADNRCFACYQKNRK